MAVGLLVLTFRHVDLRRAAAVVGSLGPSALLLLVPSALSLGLETAAWRRAFAVLGARTSFLALLRVRIAAESIGAALPFGVFWSESVKPHLLARHSGVPISVALAGMTARKYLLLSAQAAYLLAGFVLGLTMLRAGFARVAGTPALAFIALVASVALATAAELFRLALSNGKAFGRATAHLARLPWEPLRRALARAQAQATRTDQSTARFFGAPRRVLAPLVALCFAAWLFEATETWLILHALGSNIAWGDALGVETLVVLARHVLVALPGGLGAQELGYATFLGGTGRARSLRGVHAREASEGAGLGGRRVRAAGHRGRAARVDRRGARARAGSVRRVSVIVRRQSCSRATFIRRIGMKPSRGSASFWKPSCRYDRAR